jgi:hypothetical protein
MVESTKNPLYIKFDNGNTIFGYTTGEAAGGEGLNIRGECHPGYSEILSVNGTPIRVDELTIGTDIL